MNANKQSVWYAAGLRFTCTQCGHCCTGAPGYVWVTDEEIQHLANHLGLTETQFRKRYIRQVGDRWSLREFANGDCVFYDSEVGCKVYSARPRQCQTFPFWESNLRSREHWQAVCEDCEGAGTSEGQLYSLEEIQSLAHRPEFEL